jgi:hypothetical protein
MPVDRTDTRAVRGWLLCCDHVGAHTCGPGSGSDRLLARHAEDVTVLAAVVVTSELAHLVILGFKERAYLVS